MGRTNAGYVITDSIFIGTVEFVIGYNPDMSSPYVTWACKGGTDYYWGHYMSNRRDAEKDLLERAQSEMRLQEEESMLF